MISAVPLMYLSLSSTCILFSVFTIISRKTLKFDDALADMGKFLFFAGITCFFYGIFHLPELSSFKAAISRYRIITNIFSSFVLAGIGKRYAAGRTWPLIFTLIKYFLFSLLFVTIADIIFGLKLLITENGQIISMTVLCRFIFMPLYLGGHFVVSVILHHAGRKYENGDRIMIKMLNLSILAIIPFNLLEFFHFLLNPEPFESTLWWFSIGILLQMVVTMRSVLVIQSMMTKYSSIRRTASSQADEDCGSNSLYQKIIRKMKEDGLFYDPDLSLESLAEELGESRHRISRIINRKSGHNFNLFLNSFRIEEMKMHLEKTDSSRSIIDIGYQAGFNSRTSMNRMFYHFCNMSPRQYQKNCQKNIK